jgi:DNA-binding SARP family transcriptional activator
VLKLQLLGGVLLQDEDGLRLGAAASTRRALALLAALGVAGESGVSRDKLVALLWPESDAERARHSLTQALYEIRRAVECDDLFIGTSDLRLNPARIIADVSEMEGALSRGDLERAVGAYRGAFLDGFYMTGSAEFERWGSAQRARFEERYTESLHRLAKDAEERSDHRRALEWWRRLADVRPLDSGVIVRLMRSMAATGDRASALNLARVHAVLLREELGIAPDAAVTELATQLRTSGETSAAALPPLPPLPSAITATIERVSALAVATLPRAKRFTAAVLAATIVLLAAAVFLGERGRGGATRETRDLIVAPFRVVGASADLRHLSEGIVELLSGRMGADSAPGSDAGALITAWRAAGYADAPNVSRSAALSLATRLGARRIVIGSIVGAPNRMIVAATMLRAADGSVLADVTADGRADSLPQLMDRLAAKLLLAGAGESPEWVTRIARGRLVLPAVRAYAAGHAAARAGRPREAIASYDRALRLDSTFARAALQLASTADRISDADARHRSITLLWPQREALDETERALLGAWTGPRYPEPATVEEQLSAWRNLVDVAPRSPDAWVALATRFYHDGSALGLVGADERARSSLERALSLDPRNAPGAELLAQLGRAEVESTTSIDSGARRVALGDTLSGVGNFLRWRTAVARSDDDALRRIRSRFRRLRPSTLRLIAMGSQYDDIAPEDGERAARLLAERASNAAERADALEALHSLLVNQGRMAEALEATARLRESEPGLHVYLRLRVLDAIYGGGDTAAAAAAAADLDRLSGPRPAGLPITSATWLSNTCVMAQWRLHRGDTTGVRSAIAELHGRAANHPRPRVATASPLCAALLDAWLGVHTGSRDAAVRVARLDSLALTPESAGDGVTYAPLALSRLYVRLGDRASALRAIRKRSYMSVWPRYLAAMRREEAAMRGDAGNPG